MMKTYGLLIVVGLMLVAGLAEGGQRVCTALEGDGFSDNHTGAPITGNWADLAFAYGANNQIIGGTGALYLCDDDNAPNPSCSAPVMLDVVLTPDAAIDNAYWVSSDSYPGWGFTTTAATKTKAASSVLGGKSGVIARFSLDSDSDLVVAKLVDVSAIVGYPVLCGQLWNTLGATTGAPVCVEDSDCGMFAAGDVCQGGFCVSPPPPPPQDQNDDSWCQTGVNCETWPSIGPDDDFPCFGGNPNYATSNAPGCICQITISTDSSSPYFSQNWEGQSYVCPADGNVHYWNAITLTFQ